MGSASCSARSVAVASSPAPSAAISTRQIHSHSRPSGVVSASVEGRLWEWRDCGVEAGAGSNWWSIDRPNWISTPRADTEEFLWARGSAKTLTCQPCYVTGKPQEPRAAALGVTMRLSLWLLHTTVNAPLSAEVTAYDRQQAPHNVCELWRLVPGNVAQTHSKWSCSL